MAKHPDCHLEAQVDVSEMMGAEIYLYLEYKGNKMTARVAPELGKVDVGGGGTIAYLMAKYGMNVIDSGVPVLSMHAPWEIISKADLYEALKGYIAFLNA